MSDVIEISELRDAVRPVLTGLRAGAWPIPEEQGRGLDAALWEQCAELGWLQLTLPEERGGLGLGFAHLRVVYEEMGRALGSVPYLSTMLAIEALSGAPGSGAIEGCLDAMAAGDCRAAIALPQTHACLSLNGDGAIAGTVGDVLFADVADLLLLPVRTGNGHALAVISAKSPEVAIRKRSLIDLTRSSADIAIDALSAGGFETIELDDAAWEGLLDHAVAGLACDSVGASEALFELTLDYLNTREQFGRLIGSFQALKHRAADWKCSLEIAGALVRQSAGLIGGASPEARAAASGARFVACDTFAEFAGDAIQLHGGIGFTWEHPCHLFLKRAKLSQQLFGNSTFHKERVARARFGESAPQSAAPAPIPA